MEGNREETRGGKQRGAIGEGNREGGRGEGAEGRGTERGQRGRVGRGRGEGETVEKEKQVQRTATRKM